MSDNRYCACCGAAITFHTVGVIRAEEHEPKPTHGNVRFVLERAYCGKCVAKFSPDEPPIRLPYAIVRPKIEPT